MPKTSREIVQEELQKWEDQQLLIRRRNRERLEELEEKVRKTETLAKEVIDLLADLTLTLEAHVDITGIETQLNLINQLTENWNDGET